jgi:hypothetical protein
VPSNKFDTLASFFSQQSDALADRVVVGNANPSDQGETMSTREEFSPPHNWCDSRCQRCPIGDCPVRLRLVQHDWGHQMRAEAPHDEDVRIEDVLQDFRKAMNKITDIAVQVGSGHDAPERRPRFVSLDAQRLSDVACRFFAAVHDAVKVSVSSGSDPAITRVHQVLRLISLVRIKAARLAEHRTDLKDDGWEPDALPNLLLLDATERQLRQPLQTLQGAVPGEAWALAEGCRIELQHVLSEQLAGRVDAQRLMSRLIRQRRAPSPFCTV